MFGAMMITGSDGTYTGSSPGGVGGYGAYNYSYSIPAGSSLPSGGSGTYASGAITSTGAAAPATVAEAAAAAASGNAPGGIVASLLSSFGPFGERGPYTELNYPEMRFLRAGENPTELLSSLRTQEAVNRFRVTPIGWGVLALMLIATLKGK